MGIKRILVLLLYGILLIPAAPAGVFFPLFEPYTFGKTELFEILVEAMAIVWLAGYWHQRRELARVIAGHKITRAIVLLLAALAASTLAGTDISASFWGSSARGDGLFVIAHFMLFFAVLASVFEKNELRKALRFSVFASLFVALYGALQYFHIPWVRSSEGDIFGTIGNPAYLATYLSFHIFLAVSFARETTHPTWKLGFQVVIGLESIVVLLTHNRAGIIGLALGALIASYPYAKESFLKMPAWKKAATRSAVLWCIFAFLMALPNIISYAQQDTTIQSRALGWRAALATIPEHPILGHGANQFEHAYADYVRRLGITAPTQEAFDKPHNVILETAFSWGLLGLAAYLWLWYTLIKVIQNTYAPRERSLWYGMLAAYAVSLLFLFDTFVSLLMFFALLAFFAIPKTPTSSHPHVWKLNFQTWGTRQTWIMGMTGVAFFAGLFLAFHFKPLYSAYYARALFVQAQKTGMLDERLEAEALRYPSFNSYFIRNAIRQFERAQ
ncbi:hypothetical protein A3C91_00285 [Candidatus Azambacteria bacterium RIFCSPHIGHO2_02_FULL_52_12]|uniref:O-antigen ligase-related domain-containing protein n=1 Tax=Candidatus Azambacteria bacterium RIFCSPLOWO2_01_FULL_46_25 TaxID=1797298 RepID=A0A1F5BUL3_9BACT|nr:MAG: hypothetical protein A3C91_00285 [Candidatus Azambacteria bacterium RIFCSPHIGHO2_02_FULL_52_12]OGD34294.1 MAG: hypothetical protein A2988_02075 [Candidatus Azambacteria bacterium RIFCSPLOWO2_01_FULL_46_25]OGD37557.1 MAG: hypothetical protein A2850_00735 [Candidatus Azambacteria bacterium RIFCSPHIGHO2_01_FULL_51_74]